MNDREIPLTGGNVAASVVRVGDTVRKPPTPHDVATSALLDALKGITGVPRAMGHDAQGRRILSYLPGRTSFPVDMWETDITLVSAARLLRQIHDTTVPLCLEPHTWAYAFPDAAQHEVICHNDFAPYNMMFGPDGTVTGVFDFDLAGPGPRARDLAYLAFWLVPLGQQDPAMGNATHRDIQNGHARLHRLCAAYGLPCDAAFLTMVDHVLHHMSDPVIAQEMIGAAAAQKLADGGHFAHWAAERADFAAVAARFI